MNTKLTLSVSESVVVRAKKYAKSKGTSISFIVESYLKSLMSDSTDEIDRSSNVSKLKGIISLPDEYDYKKDLGNLYSK
jgi:hypothetical protein